MARNTARYRQASRLTTRHEVQIAGGEWLAVERITTRSGTKSYHLVLTDGSEAELPYGAEVMSRLRGKGATP